VLFRSAAIPRVPRSIDLPMESHDFNATGTLNVLEAARDLGVRRVVYSSTCALYGNAEELPITENAPVSPMSPYAASKLAGEAYCRAYFHSYGFETVCLRYFNVFGPGQDPASRYGAAPPNFASRLLSGVGPIVYGDGEQTRDFVYVSDVVAANLAAATAPAERVAGKVFNVGTGRPTTVNELVRTLAAAADAQHVQPIHEPSRPGEARDVYASVERFIAATSWRPSVSLEQGCRNLVDWLRAQPDRVVSFAS